MSGATAQSINFDYMDKAETIRYMQVDAIFEQLNRDALEQSAVPAYLIDKLGRIMYANQAACEALGYRIQQLLRMGIEDIERGITGTNWKDRFLAIVQGVVVDYETLHMRGDGDEYPAAVMMTVLRSKGQDYLCARVRDLTLERDRIRQIEQLQFAIENANDAVFLTRQNGDIFYVNQSACQQLGYTYDELIRLNVGDINPVITPEIRAQVREDEESGQLRTFETLHLRKDGSVYPVELAYNFASFDGRGFSVTFVRDITERKAMARQTEELKFAIENANDAVYLNDRDGNIYYANKSACDQVGYSYQELTRMNIADIDPGFSVTSFHRFLETGTTRTPAPTNPSHRRKDGSAFPVEVTFNSREYEGVEYFCSFVRDITRQKQATRRTEELRLALENAADAVYLLNNSGRIFYVNKSACDTLGYSFDELTNMNVVDIIPDLDYPDWPAYLEKLRLQSHMAVENIHQRKDGSVFPIDVTIKLEWYEGDEYICAIARDITERKKINEQLRKYQEHLEEMVDSRTRELREAQEALLERERLAVLGRLTGVVSHELRNPLGTIRSSIYVLQSNIKVNTGPVARAIARVERNITRCDRIIDELLDYTRARPASLQLMSLDRWLAEVIDDFEFPPEIMLNIELTAGCEVRIEPERMRRCIVNVLANACESMQGNQTERPQRIFVTTSRDAGGCVIAIRDSGPGIPEELRKKIFEPLFSTKGFGVGLGLAIVEQIMKQHNGSVEIQSNPEDGAMLLLRLPVQGDSE